NAVAIWPAVSPNVTLSISAICAARVSAGSQQRNIKRSSSSRSIVGGSTATSWLASNGRIGASRLRASIIALCATRTSQRSGSAGVPSYGHLSRARTYASCTAFSMSAKRWTPNRRVRAATTRPWHARKRWSNATMTSSARIGSRHLDHADFHVAVLQIQAGTRSCDLCRLIQRGGVDDENAADGVLRLDEGPVDHLAAANGQSSAGLIMELVRAHEPAAVAQALNPRHIAFEHDGSQLRVVSTALVNVSAAGDQHECWHQRFSEKPATVARKA